MLGNEEFSDRQQKGINGFGEKHKNEWKILKNNDKIASINMGFWEEKPRMEY